MLVTVLGMIVFLHPTIKLFVAVSIIALQFSRESYFVLLLSTVTDVRPEQSLNGLIPIFVTLLGMVTEVRPEQFQNA